MNGFIEWQHGYYLCAFMLRTCTDKMADAILVTTYLLCYTLHSKNCLRVSVCVSISASFSLSAGGIFLPIFFKLLRELILGRSVLGLQMGKSWQISTELRPLIDVRNWFSLSIFGIPLPIFFKLGMRVDIVKECSGISDG